METYADTEVNAGVYSLQVQGTLSNYNYVGTSNVFKITVCYMLQPFQDSIIYNIAEPTIDVTLPEFSS